MPSGPSPRAQPPAPAASAVLVAPGYLLTSIAGMGAVADDLSSDPTVYVFDGTSWHTGRYVDRDKGLQIALIRADVPGVPVSLPRAASRPARVLGLAALAPTDASPRSRAWRGSPCNVIPRWLAIQLDRERTPTLCVADPVREIPGAILLDADGAFAGIQVNPAGFDETGGPDAAEIRAYLDLYFATWGASVKPKPPY
uniref:Uncharacterized protein n=1 Tax=uncultured bacterium pA1 TaxID=1776268 RepID=A0A0U3SWC2_9BACT|nr:hypothetical protein [uncultured bacterium pA1]